MQSHLPPTSLHNSIFGIESIRPPHQQLGGADRIHDDWDFLVDMLVVFLVVQREGGVSHGTWTRNKDLDTT